MWNKCLCKYPRSAGVHDPPQLLHLQLALPAGHEHYHPTASDRFGVQAQLHAVSFEQHAVHQFQLNLKRGVLLHQQQPERQLGAHRRHYLQNPQGGEDGELLLDFTRTSSMYEYAKTSSFRRL